MPSPEAIIPAAAQRGLRGWPGPGLHYEFLVKKRRFVELHIENKEFAHLAAVLEELQARVEDRFPDAVCEFDRSGTAAAGFV